MKADLNFAKLMEPVARRLFGEPNRDLSDKNVLRFGTHGSLSVNIHGNNAGTWYDHEAGNGGGVLDLIRRQTGLANGAALEWIGTDIHLIAGAPEKGAHVGAAISAEAKLGPIAETYDYCDERGSVIFQVTRHRDPKDFRQRKPDGAGGWSWKVKGLAILPYRLPELLSAPIDQPVFIPEGEKDVNQLCELGLIATCNAGGAGKWRADHAKWLRGRDVVVLPDNDPQARGPDGSPRWHPDGRPVQPGQDHGADVARSLHGIARSVGVLLLPDLPLKGDVSDWILDGGTAEQLLTLAAAALSEVSRQAEIPERQEITRRGNALPSICLQGGEMHNEATAGEEALIASGVPIYQRDKLLVRPAVQEIEASRGRTALTACLIPITAAGMQDHLAAAANWEKFDGRSKKAVRVNPPRMVADTILSRVGKWKFARIAGVITTPTLRPDGSLLVESGYDAPTRLYHMRDPRLVLHPSVGEPSRGYAEKGLALLRKLLEEFPFDDDVSESVALSGLITPVVRASMSVAPMHAFRAHTPGTGKSYFTDVASAIATGQPCPVASAAPDDESETEKRLVGLLMAGYPICSLDNVNGELGGDLLCQAIERPIIRIRLLGRSDIFEIDSRATFFATGNNLRVRGDMVRRTVICNLDAGVERPELREFKADPVQSVLANRGRYVSACLVIVRAYIAAGQPSLLKPIASFEDWSGVVRSALVWLGCEDPAKSMEAARENDPELAELGEMLSVWSDALGTTSYTSQQVAKVIHERHDSTLDEQTDWKYPALRELLKRRFGERGEVNTRRLGNAIRGYEGRPMGGRRFARDTSTGTGGVARWMVVPASAKPRTGGSE